MKTWFASDLHFGHRNILKYEQIRLKAVYDYQKKHNKLPTPTTTFDEFKEYYERLLVQSKEKDPLAQDAIKELLRIHDLILINNWNSVVGKEDIVWFLGDLTMNRAAAEKARQLRGRKRIILGNHDKFPKQVYLTLGFEKVYDRPILLKQKYLLSHAPVFIPGLDMSPDSKLVQIYGHIHGNPGFTTVSSLGICACMERYELTPFEIPEFDSYNRPDAEFGADSAFIDARK